LGQSVFSLTDNYSEVSVHVNGSVLKVFGTRAIGDFTIFDCSGNTVQTGNTTGSEISMEPSAAGIYILQFGNYRARFQRVE
ncbi:MAG: hypothetical protein KDC12_10845, partial [Flavobacteriales bacterium]|nr:hypothetical protein [Flavobacteriales bacterium]